METELVYDCEALIRNLKIKQALKLYQEGFDKLKVTLKEDKFKENFPLIIKAFLKQAIYLLNKDEKIYCKEMLDFGRKILEDGIYGDFPDLKTLIYNDFGCFFRRTRQNKLAMEFFEKALNLIGEKKKGLALTLLNITALLSQISDHEKALIFAKKTLFSAQSEMLECVNIGKNSNDYLSISSILSIAYHNLANEEIYVGNRENASDCYQKSFEIAEQNLGPTHRLTNKFKLVLENFKKKNHSFKNTDFQLELNEKRPKSSKKHKKKLSTTNKLSKYHPYFEAYNLNLAIFGFKGKQIIVKPQKNPQRPFSSTAYREKSLKNIENKDNKKLEIQNLEQKGVLTWESQISDNEKDDQTTRNRQDFLVLLNNFNKKDENYNKPLRIKLVETNPKRKKTANFSPETIQKDEKKGNFNFASSPKKKSFSPRTFGSPKKLIKKSLEDQQKASIKIQRFFLNYAFNQNSPYFTIISQGLSMNLQAFQRPKGGSPSHRASTMTKKMLTGVFMTIFWEKQSIFKLFFKVLTQRKLYSHTIQLENLPKNSRISICKEIIPKISEIFCILGEMLVVKNLALSISDRHPIYFSNQNFKEVFLMIYKGNMRISKLILSVNINKQSINTINTNDDLSLIDSSLSSIGPLVYEPPDLTIEAFPLVNTNTNSNNSSRLEPLINNNNEFLEKNNIINKNNEFLHKKIENNFNEKKNYNTIETNNVENTEIIILEKNEEIESPKMEDFESLMQTNLISQQSSPKKKKTREIPMEIRLKRELILQQKKLYLRKIIKIQNFIRLTQQKTLYKLKKSRRKYLLQHFISKKRGIFINVNWFKEKSGKHILFANFIIFVEKSKKEQSKIPFKTFIDSDIADFLLSQKQPSVWLDIQVRQYKIHIRNPIKLSEKFSKIEDFLNQKIRKMWDYCLKTFIFNKKACKFCDICSKTIIPFISRTKNTNGKLILRKLKIWVISNKKLLKIRNLLQKIVDIHKISYTKTIINKLRLGFQLNKQIEEFIRRVQLSHNLINRRKLFLYSFKAIKLYARFKNYILIERRIIYERKRIQLISIFFEIDTQNLVIYPDSDEIDEFLIVLDEEKLKNETNRIEIIKILNEKLINITLIEESFKSLKKKIRIYPNNYLKSCLTIQNFLYNKLYYRKFKINIGDKNGLILVHKKGLKFAFVLKMLPSYRTNIIEMPIWWSFIRIFLNQMKKIELVIKKYLFLDSKRDEWGIIIEEINNVLIYKKSFYCNICKKMIVLIANIDIVDQKIIITVEKDPSIFYKVSLSSEISESNLFEIKQLALQTLHNMYILAEEKLRIQNDDDVYGPLISKTPIFFHENKKINGILRLLDSKRHVIILLETLLTINNSLYNHWYLPYYSEENKKNLIDFINLNVYNNIVYNSLTGLEINDILINNINDIQISFQPKDKRLVHAQTMAFTEISTNNIMRNKSNSVFQKKNRVKSPLLKDNTEKNKFLNEKKIKKKNSDNSINLKEIQEFQNEYENAARKIQSKFRSKKNIKVKINNNIKKEQININQEILDKNKVLEIELNKIQYEKAAIKIQNKFRKRSSKNEKPANNLLKPAKIERIDSPSREIMEQIQKNSLEIEQAARKIQLTFRKKQKISRKIPKKIEFSKNNVRSAEFQRNSLPVNLNNKNHRFSEDLAHLKSLKVSIINEKKEFIKEPELFKSNSFKNQKKRMSLASSRNKNLNDHKRNETKQTYKIMILPAPEDIGKACKVIQNWFRNKKSKEKLDNAVIFEKYEKKNEENIEKNSSLSILEEIDS